MSNKDQSRSRSENDQAEIRSEVLKDLCKQIKPCLPVKSFSEVVDVLGEVAVGSCRIPLKLLAAHVSADIFPIKNAKDLEAKVNEGLERAVALARSQSFPLRNQLFDEVVGALTQREARIGLRLPAIYRTYFPETPVSIGG